MNNQIPDWNDLVYHADWQEAREQPPFDQQFPGGHRTRLPGAVRGLLHAQHYRRPGHHQIDRMRHRRPRPLPQAGSGLSRPRPRPASAWLWSAPAPPGWPRQQLARAGHDVHVYEKHAQPGGLLRYGIPDFKMEKYLVERRVEQMEAEGVTFHCNVHVGHDISARKLERDYDAVLLPAAPSTRATCRSRAAICAASHYAMNFLPQQNRRVSGEPLGDVEPILADGQAGGGDRRRRYRLGLHRHLLPPGRASR